MKNFWLNKFRTGRRVRYKGADKNLEGKVGYIVRIFPDHDWVDVQFEFNVKPAYTKVISVEKDSLEII